MHMEHLSRSLGKHPHRPALCLCRVSRQETGIPHVSRVDRCVCCRLRGQVHDREPLQLYLLQFLSADDRFYFSAAAHTELRTSHTRCPCGCYTLAERAARARPAWQGQGRQEGWQVQGFFHQQGQGWQKGCQEGQSHGDRRQTEDSHWLGSSSTRLRSPQSTRLSFSESSVLNDLMPRSMLLRAGDSRTHA